MGKTSIDGTGERFRQIADELFDGNKSELARSLGMKPSSFAKYTDGSRRPGSRILERLSRLGVNINWFLSGTGPILIEELSSQEADSPPIRLVDGGGSQSCGEPTSMEHVGERFFCLPVVRTRTNDAGLRLEDRKGGTCLSETFVEQHFGIHPERLREFRVSGNAMAETIRPGDRLILDIGGCESVIDGEICLVAGRAGVMLRRIQLTGDGVILSADNQTVDDQHVRTKDWENVYRPLAKVLEIIRTV